MNQANPSKLDVLIELSESDYFIEQTHQTLSNKPTGRFDRTKRISYVLQPGDSHIPNQIKLNQITLKPAK